MEVLATGDRQQQQLLREFSTHMSPFSETEQELVAFTNPSRASVHHRHESPQKLRIRCNGRSCSVSDADPIAQFRVGSAADYGESYDQHFEAQGGEFLTWKRKRKRTSSSTTSTRTRRRRSKRLERFERVEHFVQNLVNKMVEKQEEMHMQLIQMVQDKEKERIAKEEAWKQHELDRIARDEELRSQETARSLALISFVHNLLGSEAPHIPQPPPPVATTVSTQSSLGIGVQIPQPPLAPQVVQPVANVPVQNLVGMCIQVSQPPPRVEQPVAAVSPTPSDNRWLQPEVGALIALRASLGHKLHIPGLPCAGSDSPIPCATKALWDEVSIGMKGMGFDRTARKCREKWENMNKYFKRAIAGDKKRFENAKTCHYFKELECFYKNGLLNMGNGLSPTDTKNEANSEKETEYSILGKVATACSTIPSVLNSNQAAERLSLMVSPAI